MREAYALPSALTSDPIKIFGAGPVSSYYLSNLHKTWMDGASAILGILIDLTDLDAESGPKIRLTEYCENTVWLENLLSLPFGISCMNEKNLTYYSLHQNRAKSKDCSKGGPGRSKKSSEVHQAGWQLQHQLYFLCGES